MKKIIGLLVFICILFVSCTATTTAVEKTPALEGTWILNFISGPKIAFDGLYPNNKPTIAFDINTKKISGNNSCNQYFGALIVDGNKIDFKNAKMGMTMMACQGNGDTLYMSTLDKIDSYSITDGGKTLNLMTGSVIMMRFSNKI